MMWVLVIILIILAILCFSSGEINITINDGKKHSFSWGKGDDDTPDEQQPI